MFKLEIFEVKKQIGSWGTVLLIRLAGSARAPLFFTNDLEG